MTHEVIDALLSPDGRLDVLSKTEVQRLLDTRHGGLYPLFRSCALAVLNTGNDTDNARELLNHYQSFQINILQRERGIKLELKNAPATAFVDGVMIKGIHEHLFSALRDILFTHDEILSNPNFDLQSSAGITDSVFHILRNANLLCAHRNPKMVVCWGGHAIGDEEYGYTKRVGYQLGLRDMDICTGCGPGAMKGPMKGATIGHAKQRITNGRYIGISEPGIIAAEAPNPIVNDLVIMPDIEKRLEAFVRLGHGIIVFPGGVGTAEEILYILGILLHPDNTDIPFPLIFTGPACSSQYFAQIDHFIGTTLGKEAQKRYKIIIENPQQVALAMQEGIAQVRAFRKSTSDAYYFGWTLKIDHAFQQPFDPSHENMRNLSLYKDEPPHLLAANLRRAFSGVVAGNVKESGMAAIEKHGLFEIRGERSIMEPMDALLTSFVQQERMKLPGSIYTPCYRIST